MHKFSAELIISVSRQSFSLMMSSTPFVCFCLFCFFWHSDGWMYRSWFQKYLWFQWCNKTSWPNCFVIFAGVVFYWFSMWNHTDRWIEAKPPFTLKCGVSTGHCLGRSPPDSWHCFPSLGFHNNMRISDSWLNQRRTVCVVNQLIVSYCVY